MWLRVTKGFRHNWWNLFDLPFNFYQKTFRTHKYMLIIKVT
jgi:hypothetical protein